mgnify:CR=1 FL=1
MIILAGQDSPYLKILAVCLHQAGYQVSVLIEKSPMRGGRRLPFIHRVGESLYQRVLSGSHRRKKARHERYWEDRLPSELPFPVYRTPSLNSADARRTIRRIRPEMMLTYGPRILKEKTFSIPARGSFNFHAGKLPDYRGTLTEFWTLYDRRYQDVGVSCHRVSNTLDGGDLAFFLSVPAKTGDDELDARLRWQRRLMHVLPNWVQGILEDRVSFLPQSTSDVPPYRTPLFYQRLRLWFRNLQYRKNCVEEEISLPPGKKAAFCISSDIDCTDVDRYQEVHDWFSDHPPLDQFRDSLFFFQGKTEASRKGQVFLFEGLSQEKSPKAFSLLLDSLQKGKIETIHGWGDFSEEGGFTRGHAERALEWVKAHGQV